MTKRDLFLTAGSITWGVMGFAIMLGLIHHHTSEYSPKEPSDIKRTTSAFSGISPTSADVVVIGTSHLYRGFDPIRFEEETGLSAYNLSFNGMSAPEMSYMVDLVSRLSKAKNVKYVLLEGRGFSLPDDKNLSSQRVIHASQPKNWGQYKDISFSVKDYKYWKPRIMATLAISKLQSYVFPSQSMDYIATIENGELRRRSLKAKGVVVSGASPLKKAIRSARTDLAVVENKGYGYQDGQIKPAAIADMKVKYAELTEWDSSKSKLSDDEKSHFKKMINALKAQGVKTQIVLPPTISPEWMRTHDKFTNSDLKTHTYDLRIHLYPQDFEEMSLWADHGHLNNNGATIFTDLLAKSFGDVNMRKKTPEITLVSLIENVRETPDCEVN